MFVGHYAVALAAKRFAPKRSAGWTFLAVQLLDVLWAPLILAGVEHVRIVPGLLPASAFDFYDMPWTHSLVLAALWAVAFGALLRSVVMGACVFSHWLLDLVVHRPDLPLYPGGMAAGLGLWRFREATAITETVLLLIGLIIYLRATKDRSPAGRWAMPVYVAVLAAIGWMNLYGPPPASMTAVAIAAEVSYLLFALVAAWIDRLRFPS